MILDNKLLKVIPKLDTVQFIALARLLKVQLVSCTNPEAETPAERYTAREFNEVLADIITTFETTPRARRREILQILNAAVRAGDDDADNP